MRQDIFFKANICEYVILRLKLDIGRFSSCISKVCVFPLELLDAVDELLDPALEQVVLTSQLIDVILWQKIFFQSSWSSWWHDLKKP
jgi:hypothetical protein